MVFKKIQKVENDLAESKERLTSDISYWTDFLKTLSYHYKHTFDEQIMIHRYHPEFKACATLNEWRNMGRSVNSNLSNSVATVYNGKMHYLIDITQTTGQRKPWVWEMNDTKLNVNYSNTVSDLLAAKHHLTAETFEERIYEFVLNYTSKHLENKEQDFIRLVSESAAYAVIYRCCPDEAEPSLENLTALDKYTADEIGEAVTKVTSAIFAEIEPLVKSERKKSIENLRRNEHGKDREDNKRSTERDESNDRGIYAGHDSGQRNDLHTSRGAVSVLSVSGDSAGRDNMGGTSGISGDVKRSGYGRETGNRTEGIVGSNIYDNSSGRNDTGILQDSSGILQADSTGITRADTTREIRDTQEGISSEGAAGTVQLLQNDRTAEQSSDRDKPASSRNGRYDKAETHGKQSGIQSGGGKRGLHDENTADEQLYENSRGRNSERSDIQIIGNTPYRYIAKKTYRKYPKETGLRIAEELEKSNIKFSGKVTDESITFTVGKADIDKFESISHEISGEKEKFANGEPEKSDITQADIDVLRSLEPRKSILNFTAEEISLTEKWQKRFDSDIHEKSPYYRAVNGDWRENEDSKVDIINVEDKAVNLNSVRNDIKDKIIYRGNVINDDSGWNIQVSRKGLEDTVHYANKNNDEATLKTLYSLNDVVKNAVLLDSIVSENNNSNKAFNTAFMHKMYSLCRIGNEPYIAKLAVEEFSDNQNGTLKRLYNVQDIKIEPLRHVEFTETYQLAQSVLNGTNISISDLFKIVKDTDKEFYVNKREDEKEIETSVEDSLEFSLEFSESYEVKIFQEEYLKGEPVSFALGNALLEYLDEKQHIEREIPELNAGWYHKTGFRVDAVINGEEFGYEGRYDIGDGKDSGNGTIVNHIRDYNEIMVKKNPYHLDAEEIKAKQEVLDKFIPFLEEHSALNENEQNIFNAFKEKYPIRHEAVLQKSELQNAAVESTADYSNAVFHSETIDNNVQNSDGTYGKTKEFYRIVIDNDGIITPYNDNVYDSFEEAQNAISENLSLTEITYDDIINRAYNARNQTTAEKPEVLDDIYSEPEIEIQDSAVSAIENNEFEEQIPLMGFAEPSESVNSREQIITSVLMSGSGFEDGKFRIHNYLNENHSISETAKMLKDEYGNGGHSGNKYYSFVDYDPTGIKITLNRTQASEEGKTINLSWNEAAKRIINLDKEGKYITHSDIKNRINQADYYINTISPDSNDDYHQNKLKWAKSVLEENGIPDNNMTITEDMYHTDNPYVLEIKGKGSLAKIDIEPSDELWKRLAEKGLKRQEDSTDRIIFDTDNQNWNRFAIPDKWGNISNNIDISMVLTPEELKTAKKVAEKVLGHGDKEIEDNTQPNIFSIKEDNFELGGAKSKFRKNIAAIQTMKIIESEKRNASPEEQKIMSEYTGWGGLSQAFDSANEKWTDEYAELKNLLTESEYNDARSSVLTAFYTPPFIIDSIYSALSNMGFDGGSILDPATGAGNFLGKMPEEMYNKSRIYAVEKDSISGRISRLLYPDANLKVTGFEKTDLPDSFFDVAVGNVPFGSIYPSDRRYDKYNFAIHDYFFAKTLDKVRPGGIVAFITSTGTLDKQNPAVRKYISQRAELLGAVRLPNNAFKSYAGTQVSSDIIFLQKRDRMIDIAPEWVYTGTDAQGHVINNYFTEHPEMILGNVVEGNNLYSNKGITVEPFENADLKELLNGAVKNIVGKYEAEKAVIAKPAESKNQKNKFIPEILPADPSVKNFSYAEINGKVFYRENSVMTEVNVKGLTAERLKGMCGISNCVRKLLDMQLADYSDSALAEKRQELNNMYDKFTRKYGLLNQKANISAFREDVSIPLVLSLERVKNDKLISKADIFTKRTLKPPVRITHAETAADALAVSISEKAGVDLEFMSQLMNDKPQNEITAELKGAVYLNPENHKWETADEYLSGNIRKKLAIAKEAAAENSEYAENVDALEKAMPDRIEAGDIQAKLGSPWIGSKYIEEFMYELFETPGYSKRSPIFPLGTNYIGVNHNEFSAKWSILNKSLDKSIKVTTTYGTGRKSGYEILEDSLNMVDTTVRDKVYNPEKEKDEYVINHDETLLARQKQEQIEQAFQDWIFKDPQRRDILVEKYNTIFNSIRPRQYDGSHLTFVGMNPEITLKQHQKDAVAHALYGGNTLFAHKVGAGKSFEMIAAAMEGKRLGLHNKSLIAVPNHMTQQMANDVLTLYPNANILVAEEKDFQKQNRQKLCAKIATGNFDIVIVGHSQLIKIPVSREREEQFIKSQIDELVNSIAEMKAENAENYTIKDMERTRQNYQDKLQKLLDKPLKDDVVTFEQMGIDKLFIDEADMFKNLGINTKMRNISGVAANRDVQKTQDLYVKCQYLDELTNSKGIVFATGTPVSNSISELYIMQKYLQSDYLKECGLTHFDAWAANFAQKVTKLEYAPTGKGFRQKTRLAKFANLPELTTAFKECADIKTAEDLKLPEPECERHIVAAEPSTVQKELIEALAERAEQVHNKQVTPDVDNMLKITTDGIKIGLDQRLMNPLYPDNPDSKINLCVNNVLKIWEDTKAERKTQVIFCDYSTPKKNGAFNLYDDVKSKLIAGGIPENEIAFIHDYAQPKDKEALFEKVRDGEVRIVLGSTQKMGAGTNIQTRLYAMHHLDAPWKPRDMEQRLGRMKRQGNMNKKVHEYVYVTKETFDSYRFQTLETKQRFISQIMTSKNPARTCEDVSSAALEFAEVKALCAGNPLIQEKMELDIEVTKLQTLKSAYQNQRYRTEDDVLKYIPSKIVKAKEKLDAADKDSKIVSEHPIRHDADGNAIFSGMTVNGKLYTDKKDAGNALISAAGKVLMGKKDESVHIGDYRGFRLETFLDALSNEIKLDIKCSGSYRITLSNSDIGNITKIDNAVNRIPDHAEGYKNDIDNLNTQLENAKAELEKPFPKEQELKEKLARQSELDRQLNLDNKEKLLGKDNDKSFEIETEADRKKVAEQSKNDDYGMDIDIDDM